MRTPLRGILAATFTPFDASGQLELSLVAPYVERLLSEGVDGLYVCGSTGEGLSLSSAERRETAQAFVEAAAGRCPVLVQVGHNSLREAAALAAHAAEIGADGVSMNAPSYFKPPHVRALADCVAEVAQAAPALPMVYYHIPALTGVELDPVAALGAMRAGVPSLSGVKFTTPRVQDLMALLEVAGDEIDVLWGVDEMLLAGWSAGARACVGSTYNLALPLYRRLLRALEAGELEQARIEQARSCALVRALLAHGGNAAIKTGMALSGMDLGSVRLPQVAPDAETRASLAAELERIGFASWGRA